MKHFFMLVHSYCRTCLLIAIFNNIKNRNAHEKTNVIEYIIYIIYYNIYMYNKLEGNHFLM